MLLTNFGAICANAFCDDKLTNGIKCTTGELPVSTNLRGIPTSKTFLGAVVSNSVYSVNIAQPGNATWSFGFGDGTTPPTVDDYKLSGNLVVPSVILNSGSVSNGSNGCTWQMIVINNGTDPITINEIGLFIQQNLCGCVMLTRDVLPETVTLNAGESKGFQIYIDTQSFVSNASQA